MVILILISQWTTMRLLSQSFGRIWTITLSVTYLMIAFYDSHLCFEYLAHVEILCALEVSLCQENLFFILKCCFVAACIIMCIVTDLYRYGSHWCWLWLYDCGSIRVDLVMIILANCCTIAVVWEPCVSCNCAVTYKFCANIHWCMGTM